MTMKQFSFLLFILLSISILVSSCDKEPEPNPIKRLSGRVLQINTNIPVPNATVVLYVTKYSKNFGGPSISIALDTIVTDKEGNYAFTYEQTESSNEYSVVARADNFAKSGAFEVNNKSKVDIIIKPFAWIKVNVINTPPVEPSDWLIMWGWLRDGTSKTDRFSSHGKCDTTFVQKVIGNTKIGLVYTLESNTKPEIKKIDSIYCKSLDTTFHRILY